MTASPSTTSEERRIPVPLSEQAEEAELHFLGIRDILARAVVGKIKRGDHEIERLASRVARAEAAACTLRTLALHRQQESGRCA